MAKLRMLVVDDEPQQLAHLHKELAPMQPHWDMTFAKNGVEALRIIEQAPCEVILTDLTMPTVDGIQLLAEVVKRVPHSLRFIMTHPQEREHAFRSTCLANQFLVKPCKLATINEAINQALHLRGRLFASSVQAVVSRGGVLPSAQPIYARLLQVINRPDSSLADVAALIKNDLAMSARVLQMVNSAFFGVRRHVSNIDQAVSLLGLDTIKSLVAWFHLGTKFNRLNVPGLSLEEVQRHSFLTARYAEGIAVHLGCDALETEDIMMAGMFHEIGQLILAQAFPAQYTKVLFAVKTHEANIAGEESGVFGTTHAEVGAYLLASWGFHDQVAEAVCFHHRPDTHIVPRIDGVSVLYLADMFATGNHPALPPAQHGAYLQRLRLTPHLPALEKICADISKQAQIEIH